MMIFVLQRDTPLDSLIVASLQTGYTISALRTRWTRHLTRHMRPNFNKCAPRMWTPGSPSTWTPTHPRPSIICTSRIFNKARASSPPTKSYIPTGGPSLLLIDGPLAQLIFKRPLSPPLQNWAGSTSRPEAMGIFAGIVQPLIENLKWKGKKKKKSYRTDCFVSAKFECKFSSFLVVAYRFFFFPLLTLSRDFIIVGVMKSITYNK